MRKTKSFKELKRMARLQMQGKMGILIGAMCLYLLISMMISEIVARAIPVDSVAGNVILQIVSYIVELILATLSAGLAFLHLNVACNNPAKVSDMFYVAKTHPDKAIKIEAVIVVINIILSIPSLIFMNGYGYKFTNYYINLMNSILENPTSAEIPMQSLDIFQIMGITSTTFIIYYVLILVCAIINMVVSFGLFPVFYLMLDFPQTEPMDVIKKSWNLMKGYKLRYFLLILSFIPYFILSAFTFLIPLIWVIPYMQMTNTNFYLDLISVKNGNGNTVSVEM